MASAIRDESLRNEYKQLMELLSYDFGANGVHQDIFRLFNSDKYKRKNLMFTDETKELIDVKKVDGGNRDTYYTWVGKYRRPIVNPKFQVELTCMPGFDWF